MTLGIEEGLDRCARFGVKPGLGAIAEVCRMHGDPQNALAATGVLPGGVCGAFPNETFVSA